MSKQSLFTRCENIWTLIHSEARNMKHEKERGKKRGKETSTNWNICNIGAYDEKHIFTASQKFL